MKGKVYAFARLPEEGLVQKLLSYGNKVKVIEPQSLQQKLLGTIEGIKEMYEGKN
jgi:predicted DNA-binding transcriptional regulator YafY